MTDNTGGAIRDVRKAENAIVVSLHGEVDLHSSPDVHQRLLAVAAQAPRLLVVNMSELRFIDSSGVGVLVDVFRRMRTYGGRMALAGAVPRVRSVFEITKLDQFFTMFATEEEALAS